MGEWTSTVEVVSDDGYFKHTRKNWQWSILDCAKILSIDVRCWNMVVLLPRITEALEGPKELAKLILTYLPSKEPYQITVTSKTDWKVIAKWRYHEDGKFGFTSGDDEALTYYSVHHQQTETERLFNPTSGFPNLDVWSLASQIGFPLETEFRLISRLNSEKFKYQRNAIMMMKEWRLRPTIGVYLKCVKRVQSEANAL